MLLRRRAASSLKFAGKSAIDQEAVRLGQFARLAVVLLDRLELVAEVLLDDVLHVLGQVFQLLLDLRRPRSRCGRRPGPRGSRPRA